ncbi:MAG: cyclic nucleotide-binding/CBS domain-containing protein [Actinomycetota bacterium]
MTEKVYTCEASSSVKEVAEAMVKGRFGSAIIMEGRWVGGIFTERDVLRAAASGADLNTTNVASYMTKDPMTANPDMEADEALHIMASNGFRHLPVADDKGVVGIVSLRDVMSTRIARSPR